MRRLIFSGFCGIKCRVMNEVALAVMIAAVVLAGCEKAILPDADATDTVAAVAALGAGCWACCCSFSVVMVR